MRHGAHESYANDRRLKPPTDRKFGLTIGVILLAIAIARWLLGSHFAFTMVCLAVGALLVLLGVLKPDVLAPLNKAWMKLGLLLAKFVNPIIMLVLFAMVFVPIALFMRVRGRDQLGRKRKVLADQAL
jgi:hypothetical protein